MAYLPDGVQIGEVGSCSTKLCEGEYLLVPVMLFVLMKYLFHF